MKITLLTEEQLENLEVLQKYGIKAKPTDFYLVQEGTLYHGHGVYWTKTSCPYYRHSLWVVNCSGELIYHGGDASFSNGIRPVIPLSEINKSTQNINRKIINGITKIEYGEYPQSVVNEILEEQLENLYQQNKLKKTEKIYTNMQTEHKKYTTIYKGHKKEYQEYVYRENRYIRIDEALIQEQIDKLLDEKEEPYKFSNKRDAIDKNTYWIKVEPITWLVDKKEKIAISEKILAIMSFSYNNDNNYEESDIKNFLENYFIEEIKPSKINKKINEEKINDLIELMNMLYPKEKQKEKVMIKKWKNK